MSKSKQKPKLSKKNCGSSARTISSLLKAELEDDSSWKLRLPFYILPPPSILRLFILRKKMGRLPKKDYLLSQSAALQLKVDDFLVLRVWKWGTFLVMLQKICQENKGYLFVNCYDLHAVRNKSKTFFFFFQLKKIVHYDKCLEDLV